MVTQADAERVRLFFQSAENETKIILIKEKQP